MTQTKGVIVELPSPSPSDTLFTEKSDMIAQKGFTFVFPIPVFDAEEQYCQLVDIMLKVARILNLNEIEWYFAEEDDEGPFSGRNELEALNELHSILCKVNCAEETGSSVQDLIHIVLSRLESFPVTEETLRPGIPSQGAKENLLLSWATSQGIKSKLDVAVFEGFGRGGRAVEDIAVGDVILEIPQNVIICENTVVNSDMFQALETFGGLNGETITLLWSMKERFDQQSKFAPYFASLPNAFNTGLSFGLAGLQALDGTAVLEEILQAKEHLQSQYHALFPALSRTYPLLFPEEIFTWDLFLWACELWYSNGLKIAFPDGTIKTCLLPMGGLLNHGLYPHITHYSKIDSKSKKLTLRASRPCKSGQQCFLSYGAFPNSNLLTFYGFLLNSDNPFDNIPIDIDLSDGQHRSALIKNSKLGYSHMVRGSWFSASQMSPFGLPSRLLAMLRIAVMTEDEAKTLCVLPRNAVVGMENEIQAYEALLSILTSILDSIGESSSTSEDPGMTPWDVNLATAFKDVQRKLIKSACTSCSLALNACTSAASMPSNQRT